MQYEIGLAIRLARVAVGKSQWRVAAKCNIHPGILNMIEAGKHMPDPRLARHVLNELGTDAPGPPLVGVALKGAQRITGSMK